MNRRDPWRRFFAPASTFFALLTLASISCVISLDQPTRPPPTATPPLDQVVSYTMPIYTASLEPGESIPGTQMTYINRENAIFNVTINDLPAVKRAGDSFTWKGIIAPGLIAKYSLRVSPTLLGNNMLSAGPVELWVLNPIPVETDVDPLVGNAFIHFSNIALDMRVPIGGQVPGTSFIYEGFDDQGANLTGSSSYPYLAVGDSLAWAGRLRGNVLVRYSLRVASFDVDNLRLIGTAELWIV
ncbi:MAG TPA: hypothetical protein VMZ24_01235 [Patescibacteria group bacterium]|nr:hypothetical protein [Patescibacteria group bacterium]